MVDVWYSWARVARAFHTITENRRRWWCRGAREGRQQQGTVRWEKVLSWHFQMGCNRANRRLLFSNTVSWVGGTELKVATKPSYGGLLGFRCVERIQARCADPSDPVLTHSMRTLT